MRRLLGKQDRVVDGQDESAGAELDPAGDRSQGGQGGEHLVEARGPEVPVAQADQVEAQLLRHLDPLPELVEAGLSGVGESLPENDAEVHVRPFRCFSDAGLARR